MQDMIKLTAFLVTCMLSMTSVFAQYDDDIYFSPSAEKKAQEAALKANSWSTNANDDWDVDGYNRRYTSSSTGATSASRGMSGKPSSGSELTSLGASDRDTVYIIKNNYYFSYADLLYRFHCGFYRPSWYWHTAWGWGDPFFWDRWYNDPFYWDSYYAWGWGWNWGWSGGYVAWYRPSLHYHVGWRPAPHRPAHRVGGHSVISSGHSGYHSPAIARGGNRHSGIRGGNGSGIRGGNGSGIRGGNGSGSRGSRGPRDGVRSERHDNSGSGVRGNNSGSRGHGNSGSSNYGGSSRYGGGGGHFGGGRSGGGHSGGGHSGGGGGRGRR